MFAFDFVDKFDEVSLNEHKRGFGLLSRSYLIHTDLTSVRVTLAS